MPPQKLSPVFGISLGEHLGVVVDPKFFWHMIISEVALIIKANPDNYRNMFTTSDDKQAIIVDTKSDTILPIDLVIDALQSLVPTDIELFFPEFSTKTEQYTLATQVTFCDAVSPYFDYWMLLCGIPSYDVRGTDADWTLLRDQTVALHTLMGIDKPILIEKLNGLTKQANRDDVFWWVSMFSLNRCGSGHQTEVGGWITNFYNEQPSPRYVQNYSSHIGTVSYVNLSTDKKYVLYSGLFHSEYIDDTLVPDYGYIVKEQAE